MELRSEMARLATERAQIEETLARTRQRLSRVHYEMARLYETGDAVPPAEPSAPSPGEPKKRPYGNAKAAVRVVVEILRASGAPMHTAALLEELRKRGVAVDEPAPLTRLSNWLAKAPEVKSSRASGWHLAEWPDPPPHEAKEKPSLLRFHADVLRSEDQRPRGARDVPLAEDRAAKGGASSTIPAGGGKINRGFIKGLDPERHRQRTLEGLAARKARGERVGREPTISQETWAELDRLIEQGMSARAAALTIGISPSSAQRWTAGYYRKAAPQGPEGEAEG